MTTKFWANWQAVEVEKRLFSFLSLVLALAVLLLAWVSLSLVDNRTVVILPPQVDQEFTVTDSSLSYAYFEQVAHYLADRLLTVSPPSVESSIDSVLPFLTSEPVQAKRIRDGLVSQIDAIRRDDVYQAFYPLRFVLDEKRKRMVVEGVLKKLTGNTYIGETNASVILDFVVRHGRLRITGIEVES